MARDRQAVVDGFIAGATTRAALVEALNAGAFPDGRTSEAMVALIDRARSLRAERRDLRIVCFDRWPESGDRDEAMACALLAAFDPRAVSFVLCGNIHARTSSPEYMGWHLRARHDQLLALNLEHAGGTAWCIVRDRKPGVVEFPRRPDLPPSSPLGVRLYELRDDDGYDGELVVGQITASPLARAEL
jgi:hypothetical protein